MLALYPEKRSAVASAVDLCTWIENKTTCRKPRLRQSGCRGRGTLLGGRWTYLEALVTTNEAGSVTKSTCIAGHFICYPIVGSEALVGRVYRVQRDEAARSALDAK